MYWECTQLYWNFMGFNGNIIGILMNYNLWKLMRFMVTPKKMRTSASRMVVRWYSPHLFNVSIYFGIGIYLYNSIYIYIDIELYPLKMLSLVQYIYIYVYVFPSIAFFQRTVSHINGSPWIQYSDKDSRMKSLNIYLGSSWNRVSKSSWLI